MGELPATPNPDWDNDYTQLWTRLQQTQERLTRCRRHKKDLVEALKEVQEFFETNAFRMDNLLDMHVRESVDDALKELDQ